MTNNSNENETELQHNTEKSGKGGTIARAAAGGLAGAAIGYISSEENRKKLAGSMTKENLKEKGNKLGTMTKDQASKLKDAGMQKSGDAFNKIKSSTSQLFSNNSSEEDQNDEDAGYTKLENGEAYESDQDYENLKMEHEELNNRLQGLEEKMDKLLVMNGAEAGDGEEQEEEEKSSKVDGKKTSENKSNSTGKKSSGSKKKATSNKKSSQKKKSDEEETGLTSADDTSA
jgi:hypothetical protein